MSSGTFYFVARVDGGKALTVIDLGDNVSYERSDWAVANDQNFHTPEDAIEHAKGLAKKYGLDYVPFESRYNSDLNEMCNLTLD